MKFVFGLGNPTDKYKHTRHNAGFMVLDSYVTRNNLVWDFNSKLNSYLSKTGDILLVKSQGYMNHSGEGVRKAVSFFDKDLLQRLDYTSLLVVHDDADLKFGETKIQYNVSSAGHNGVQNIIDHLGSSSFWRFRVGIGRPDSKTFDIHDWVLGSLSKSEISVLTSLDIPFDKVF